MTSLFRRSPSHSLASSRATINVGGIRERKVYMEGKERRTRRIIKTQSLCLQDLILPYTWTFSVSMSNIMGERGGEREGERDVAKIEKQMTTW